MVVIITGTAVITRKAVPDAGGPRSTSLRSASRGVEIYKAEFEEKRKLLGR